MDNFESLIRLLLEEDGYWTLGSVKVNLTLEEKRATGKPSIPRPEIDIVSLKQNENKILAMEVKSYLDSYGVRMKDLADLNQVTTKGLYKIFTCPRYRGIIEKRLLADFRTKGLANLETTVEWGLAAGKIYAKDHIKIQEIFDQNDWILWTPSEIAQKARKLAAIGYENDPFVIMTKILERNPKPT